MLPNVLTQDGSGPEEITSILYHSPTVLASVLIASLGSYITFLFCSRSQCGLPVTRRLWLTCTGMAMGVAIWSMHFTGMLAMNLQIPATYDFWLTFLSLLSAVSVSVLAFETYCRWSSFRPALIGSGCLLGIAIVSMHYISMAAMRMGAHTSHSLSTVLFSAMVACIGATLAVIVYSLGKTQLKTGAAGLVMGMAIAGMHYTAMAGTTFQLGGEHRLLDETGIPVSLLVITVMVLMATVLLIALVASSVDRRAIEIGHIESEALRLAEKHVRSLLYNNSDVVAVLDVYGNFTEECFAVERNLGYSVPDLKGYNLVDLASPNSRQKLQSWLNDLQNTEPSPLAELCLRHSDGTWRHFEAAGRNLLDDDDVKGIVVNLRCVQQRKDMEKKLSESQKLEAIGQLTGGVAHDFNNLLTLVGGNLELMRLEREDAKLPEPIERAIAAVHRGVRLTRQLLSFTRTESLEPEAVALEQVIGDTVAMLKRTMGDRFIIEVELAPGLWPCWTDRGRLEAAIINLAINSRDAMPGGGVLTVRARNRPKLDLPDKDGAADMVEISVEDTGTGMSADILKRVFDPFFTTKDKGKGTGLGLSMVDQFIKQSGGQVEIRSELGKGTTVSLLIPRSAVRPERGSKRRSLDQAPDGTGFIILVVEDDTDVRQHAASVLNRLGYKVIEASDGVEALTELDNHPNIDLVFTDVDMPRLGGIELAKKASRRHPDLPFIFTSGLARGSTEKRVPGNFIEKPYDGRDLGYKIYNVLARKRMTAGSDDTGIKSPVRILLVDDDTFIVKFMQGFLDRSGLEIIGVANAPQEAMDMAEQTKPDIALIDLSLGSANDGLMVARSLRDRLGIRSIIVSGSPVSKEQIDEARADLYLEKPFSPEGLVSAVFEVGRGGDQTNL